MENPSLAEHETPPRPGAYKFRPRIATGLEIVAFSSSSRLETYLACLPSGRMLEISSKLRDMLLLLDGSRSSEEIARCLSPSGSKQMLASEVDQTLEKVLCPHGLVEQAEGEWNPAETMRTKEAKTQGIQLCPARLLLPLTRRLRILFHRPILVVSLTLITLSVAVLFYPRIASPERAWPMRLCASESAILYALLLLSVLFHELGHLSACSFHGCEHGELRFGLYLIFPAFYSNVTRAWSLPRRARVHVDLGGVYFQMILAVPALAAYWITGRPIWICYCLALVSMAAFSLNPFLRFDGYWLCSDLLGVPNLRSRSRLYLRQILLQVMGRGVPRSEKIELHHPEQAGLLVYGILSHLFFVIGFAWLARLVAGRLNGLSASVGSFQKAIVQAFCQGDVWGLVVILFHVLISSVFLVAACRVLGQVLGGVVRILLRAVRNSPAAFGRTRTKGESSVMKGKRTGQMAGAILLVWTLMAGCGGDPSGQDPSAPREGGNDVYEERTEITCEKQAPSTDPGVGGDFACLYCSRVWQWNVPRDSGAVCFRMEILCSDVEGAASLSVSRTDGETLWERAFRTGEGGAFCVSDENPIQGDYRIELHGDAAFGLLPLFRGSVWLRVYAEKEGLLEFRKVRPP